MVIETLKKWWSDKEKRYACIFIGFFAIVLLILTFSGINFGQLLTSLTLDYYAAYGLLGIIIGIFIVSFVGNASVVFPIPYFVPLLIIVITLEQTTVDPLFFLFIALAASFGSAIGESSAWLLGRAGKELVDTKKNNNLIRLIDKGWAPALIILFAATPLTDDVFLGLLGFVGYPLWRALVWCVIGKFIMTIGIVALAEFLVKDPLGQTFLKLYGIDIQQILTHQVSAPTFTETLLSSLMWIFTLAVLLLFAFVDWYGLYLKYIKKQPQVKNDNVDK